MRRSVIIYALKTDLNQSGTQITLPAHSILHATHLAGDLPVQTHAARAAWGVS